VPLMDSWTHCELAHTHSCFYQYHWLVSIDYSNAIHTGSLSMMGEPQSQWQRVHDTRHLPSLRSSRNHLYMNLVRGVDRWGHFYIHTYIHTYIHIYIYIYIYIYKAYNITLNYYYKQNLSQINEES